MKIKESEVTEDTKHTKYQKKQKILLYTYLIEEGYVATKKEADALTLARKVRVKNNYPLTSALRVEKEDVVVKQQKKYVSRGGFKLEAALQTFPYTLNGKIGLDIGSSTGGFTDCALKHGAKEMYCVDVGTNQLAYTLRMDSRVHVFEQCNFKYLTPEDLSSQTFDFVTIDVSFTSILPILHNLIQFCTKETRIFALIKPQFEVYKEERHQYDGVIEDNVLREKTYDRVCAAIQTLGYTLHGSIESPIKGTKGNTEYIVYLTLIKEED